MRDKVEFESWQEFEEFVRYVFESHGFETQFRVVFRDEEGRSEIDVVAERGSICLAADAKRYTEGWYRLTAIKREAEKHESRCRRFSRVTGKKAIPVVVPLIDDGIALHGSCIIVPFRALNDFLSNLELYLAEFGYL